MLRLGWVEIVTPSAPIAEGTVAGVLVRVLGFWSLNLCRIVYVMDESSGPVRRFGFAYGTLEEHGERGEERFLVEHHERSGEVAYDILAVSRPNHFLARLGFPYARRVQGRFARDSMRAMRDAVTAPQRGAPAAERSA